MRFQISVGPEVLSTGIVTLEINDFQTQFLRNWARVRVRIMGHDEQEYRSGRPHRTHRQVHVIINDPSVKELRGEVDRTGNFEKGPFFECSGLYKISMPHVEAIGDYALFGCADLVEVDAPNVKSIGTQSLFDCFNLVELDLRSCTTLGLAALCGCRKLEKLRCHDAATAKKDCFSLCTAMANKTRAANTRRAESKTKPFMRPGVFFSSKQKIDVLGWAKWEKKREENMVLTRKVMLWLKLCNTEGKDGAKRATTEDKVLDFLTKIDDGLALTILSFK
ncbi:hypothetical protein TrCOL_g291 [Triparma columacea]|uniref:Uncharacterized protein n=1 Tax=Triparma columacea TaxID=722753 RepID=A0A9W7GLK7_9STRA|nr:hypothetical protein TrCOL_g291 [Triparma columacea]